MFRFMFHQKEAGLAEAFQSNLFERFADEIRVNLIPEIANAIDDVCAELDDSQTTVHRLTNILAKLCSASDEDVFEGVREWAEFIDEEHLSYGWIELLK